MSETETASEAPEEQPVNRARSRGNPLWRILRRLLMVAAVLVLALIGTLGWLLGTQDGLNRMLATADRLAPGLIEVERAQGRVLGDLSLAGLALRVPGVAVEVGSIDLRWRPLGVFGGKLRVHELAVRDVDVLTEPSKKEKDSGPITLPKVWLPLSIDLDRILVERVSIGEPAFVVERATLAASLSGSDLTLSELTLSLPEPRVQAEVRGSARLVGDYPLELDLTWDLTLPPRLGLTGTGQVEGDLAELQVAHRVEGSAEVGLDATLYQMLEKPRWDGRLTVDRVDLPAINADLPAIDLIARLTTSGDLDAARVHGTLAGEGIDLPDLGRLRALLDVTWRDRVLEISALDLEESVSGASIDIDGHLDLATPGGLVGLKARWERLRWPLTGTIVAAAPSGHIDVNGTLDDFGYTMEGEIDGPSLPGAMLSVTGQGNTTGTRIASIRIETLGGTIDAEGDVRWQPDVGWDIRLAAQDIDPGVQWSAVPATIGLDLTSAGTLEDFAYQLDGQIESDKLPAATLMLKGTGDDGSTQIRTLELATLGGTLGGTAEVGWSPEVRWDAKLGWNDIDPGRQWAEWPGRLAGRLETDGTLTPEGPELAATLAAPDSRLRGFPVAANAAVAMAGEEIRLDRLAFSSGPSRIEASGSIIGNALDVAFDLASPDLASLVPEAAGSIQAEGRAGGTLARPKVDLRLEGDGIKVAGQGLDGVKGRVDVDLAPGGRLAIDLAGRNLSAGGMVFDAFALEGSGSLNDHSLAVDVDGTPLAVDLALAGGLEGDDALALSPETLAYQGRLERLAIATSDFGNWSLSKAAPLSYAAGKGAAGPLCIRDSGNAGGCVQVDYQGGQDFDAKLDLDRLPFELLQPFMPEGLDLAGALGAKADLAARGGTLVGQADLSIPKAVLSRVDGDGSAELVDVSATRLGVTADDSGVRAEVAVPIAQGGKRFATLDGQIGLPGFSLANPARPEQSLSGRIAARIERVDIVSQFAPDLVNPRGTVALDLALSGNLAEPRLAGELELKDLAVDVPKADISAALAAVTRVDLALIGGAPDGTIALDIAKGVLRHDQLPAERPLLDISSSRLGLDAGGAGVSAKLALALGSLGGLDGNIALPGWRLDGPPPASQRLDGRLRGGIDDFSLVDVFVPDITDVAGRIGIDLGLGGTLSKPRFEGGLELADAGLTVPVIGLVISNLEFAANADRSGDIVYKGGLNVGDGRLTIDGETAADGALTTRLEAQGEDLLVANSSDYFALASPDITIAASTAGARVTGEVVLPEARINPRSIPAGTVSPSPDVQLLSDVQAEVAGGEASVPVELDVRVVIEDKVEIEAFGVRGKLKGDFKVLQEPGGELVGDGQIAVVDGTYRMSTGGNFDAAIGKPLNIEQGFIVFAKTPLSNPGLLLTVKREGGDTTAGLQVSGTAKNPKLSFFSDSDPDMSQAEISRYLLTGMPPRRSGTENNSLSVGTYIAPKLFMEYETSLGDEKDKVKLRYDLTNHIELQTESGEAQGADIFFTFER